jgi:hypothetical protein
MVFVEVCAQQGIQAASSREVQAGAIGPAGKPVQVAFA